MKHDAQNENVTQVAVELLYSYSKACTAEGMWDLAYVHANEAHLLLQRLKSSSSSFHGPTWARAIERARQNALYQLMPKKRLVDRVESLLKRARECIIAQDHENAVKLCTTAYALQLVKTPAPLLLRAKAHDKLGQQALSYVDASEGLSLTNGPSPGYQLLGLQRDARNRLPGYRPENRDEDNDVYSRDVAWMGNELESHQARPQRYHHSCWPGLMEIAGLNIDWPHPNQTPHCGLDKPDGSFVSPEVYFHDLPTFFANHVKTGSMISDVRLSFCFDPGSRYFATPAENHLRTLIAIATCRKPNSAGRVVSPLGNVQYVRLLHADFYNITPATFKQLFTSVLAAKRYQFLDLKRLPIGVSPTDFLQHPSLVACRDVLFSFFDLLHLTGGMEQRMHEFMPVSRRVVQFSSAEVLAYLKAWSRATPKGQLPPYLIIHEAYLAEGLTALVEKVRDDFLASLSSKYLFDIVISYRDASTFDGGPWKSGQGRAWSDGQSGEWRNSLGERLCIYTVSEAASRKQFLIYDKCQVCVCRCGDTPPK